VWKVREKELSKPIIQLFYGSNAQKEVEITLQTFLNLRTEKKEITLEPVLHPIVANLVSENGTEVSVAMIWEALKNAIDGHYDDKKPNEYQTLEYGTIYNNTISNILEHTFGGRPKHRRQGNTFIFDPEELVRIGKAYNITTKIQTKMLITAEEDKISIGEGCEGCEAIREEPITANQDQKSGTEDNLRGNIDNNKDQKEEYNGGKLLVEPSLLSQPSQQHNHSKESNYNITKEHDLYWIQSLALWGCKYCDLRLDKFGMQNTPCKRNKKAKW
jgi:hypothetical protein